MKLMAIALLISVSAYALADARIYDENGVYKGKVIYTPTQSRIYDENGLFTGVTIKNDRQQRPDYKKKARPYKKL